MFLLVTGASGVGKSTVRGRIDGPLADHVECVELGHVAAIPNAPDEAWRQRAVAKVVDLAIDHQEHGRHLLLCGDPVPPAEVFAAPGISEVAGGAVLLLQVNAEEQARRLTERGDDSELLHHHLAFQALLQRTAAADVAVQEGWSYAEVAASAHDVGQVAGEVLRWVQRMIRVPAGGCGGLPGPAGGSVW